VNLELPQIDWPTTICALKPDSTKPFASQQRWEAIEHLPDAKLTRLRVGANHRCRPVGDCQKVSRLADVRFGALQPPTEKGWGIWPTTSGCAAGAAQCDQRRRVGGRASGLKKLEQPFSR
jgi:hypothetical protein